MSIYITMRFIVLLIFVLLGLCECSNDGVGGDLPPPEVQCPHLISCDTFPQNTICGLAVDGCWRPYDFNNDCQLELYNCEHPSNPFYKYWDGPCYPDNEMVTISPIEREPVENIDNGETVTISPIETEPVETSENDMQSSG